MTTEQTAGDYLASRFRFWRNGFWRVSLTNLCICLAASALIGDHIYTAYHPPEALYFFTDGHGNLIQNTPLSEPVMSDADLMAFTSRSMLAVYNFDYVHYRETLSREAAPNFTINGWNGVVAAIEATRNLDEVKAHRMVVTATALASPSIKQQALIGDHLAWKIRLPIHVTYADLNETRPVDLDVTAIVTRVPATLYANGVAIDSFTADPKK